MRVILVIIFAFSSILSINAFSTVSYKRKNLRINVPLVKEVPSNTNKEQFTLLKPVNAVLEDKNYKDVNIKLNEIFSSKNEGWGSMFGAVLAVCLTMFIPQQALASGLVDDVVEKANSSGFIQAFLLIFVSEIGDKTFFIAGLLAAKYSRIVAFVGSIGALAIMTVISTLIGQIFHNIPEGLTQGIPFDDYIAVAAFAYFGGKTLYEALQLVDGDNSGIDEEKEDAEKAVEEITSDQMRRSALAAIVQTFSLVFAAEIGDRSFLSTIALSAALNPFAVSLGAIAAHGAATGVAVVGGAAMSKYLSERQIGLIGGSLFLVFALTTALNVF
jgi:putative Ca2+/H+ antiporter (TMEM165/GDT1 family)